MNKLKAKIVGLSRHRLLTDGEGVTTLVAFHGCPLRCKYCLNPHSLGPDAPFSAYTPESLYEAVKIDELYFIATGGGVTFGGGEPAMQADFIVRFRNICGSQWRLTLETSLNVPTECIERLLPVIDSWIIDIKDMNHERYRNYTGIDNARVIDNLKLLANADRQNDCTIRIPLIPNHNSATDRNRSHEELTRLGFASFDFFTYQILNH